MRAGRVVAALGAALVILMAPGMATAQAGLDATEEIDSQLRDASKAAKDHIEDAEAQKNETGWVAAEHVLYAYGTVIEYWPQYNQAFRLAEHNGQVGVPPPPVDPEAVIETPPKDKAAPPPAGEVRDKVEKFLGNQTNETAPETNVTSEADTPRANETTVNATTAHEPIATPQAEPSWKPERAARSHQDPPAPMGTVVSEVRTLPMSEIAALAAASVAFGLIAWLVSQARFVGRLMAGLPFARLFSRQTGVEVLQSPVRARIHAAVTHEPGITFAKLRQLLEMPPSTLRYHLAILRRENLVRVTRRGRILHYHDGGARVDGGAQARGYLFWRGRGSIVSAILRHPGANQQAVARLAGLPASRVSVYTRELAEAGLVRSERVGRYRTYYPTAKLEEMRDSGQVPTSS